jgi:hypothetical protein
MGEQDAGVLEGALRLARELRDKALASGEHLIAEAEAGAIARLEEKLVLLQRADGRVVTVERHGEL